ncbi:MAG: phosphomannomutase/phosphoglucomutase, partial [Mycobacteriales bacterium]
MPAVRDVSGLIKAYDVRGVVPDELDEDLAGDIGRCFGALIAPAAAVVIGHDMRETGEGLAAAFAHGLMERGIDVIRIGLASTDQLYFASGKLDIPGAMFTASHNPAKYNGIKMCYAGAKPVGQDSGLNQIKEWISTGTVPTVLGGLPLEVVPLYFELDGTFP